jgi:hypothetical protein
LRDRINNIVALFEKSHSGIFHGSPKQAKLSVSPIGLPIVDEIVASFVLIEQRRRTEKKAAYGDIGGAVGEVAAAVVV